MFSLMKSNHHLDESAAKLLIERALIQKEDGTYEFSRDINVKVTVSSKSFKLVNLLSFKKIIKMSFRCQ